MIEPVAEGGTGAPTVGQGGLSVPLGVHQDKLLDSVEKYLTQMIEEGDRNLRDHITAQIEQIRLALEAAEKLELQRIEAVQREAQIIAQESEKAILKAEAATNDRFQSFNAFRDQLRDQTSSFLPREVAEAQFAEMRRSINEIAEKVGKLA